MNTRLNELEILLELCKTQLNVLSDLTLDVFAEMLPEDKANALRLNYISELLKRQNAALSEMKAYIQDDALILKAQQELHFFAEDYKRSYKLV